MASAYVTLLSLNSTIEHYQQRSLIFPEKFQIEFLKENTTFLLQFFEEHHDSKISRQEILDLEIRTKYVALEADCMIDSHAMDQNQMLKKHGYHGDCSSQLFPEEDVHRILNEFKSIKEKAMEIMKDVTENAAQLSANYIPPANPSRCARSAVDNKTMIGFDKHLVKVMERITGHESTLQILPIVGPGGIGKTTLAKNVYDSKLIVEHFRIRLWATVSQSCSSYTVHDILQSFLRNLNSAHENIISPHESNNELGDKLYKSLFGRRYLIVLDDIWSAEDWNTIGRFFPKNDNGSRIIFTTRILPVASHLGLGDSYKLNYLNHNESWKLLERKVFGQSGCPSALEDVGKRIAVSCQGLPLAIVLIAGILVKSDMTKESWEKVAGHLIPTLHSETDSQCLKILSLSYDNLPIYLRACFLYMSCFRKSYHFPAAEIIRIWVVDGILKPHRDKCLEETAIEYLADLVERNLISVCRQGSTGKMLCFRIHDLLHDLCRRKADKHRFINCGLVENDRILVRGTNPNSEYRIPLSKFSGRHSCADLCSSNWANKWVHKGADYKLFDFRLRYIHLSASQAMDTCAFSASLAKIFMFQNLQALWINETPANEPVVLPPEIWDMSEFRHLLIKQVVLPDPLPTAENHATQQTHCVLAKLQTLWDVHCFRVSEEVVKRIPNLKKLKITYTKGSEITVDWSYYCLHNLAQLCKLESLSFCVCGKISALDFSLPQSLRKLTLDGCKLPWEEMTMVGSLPNLEVLRLQNDAFCGREWRPTEGEFCHLRALHLQHMSFQQWEADCSHFPRLERLILYNVWRLKEIPLGIGDITTLQFISAKFCRFSLESSVSQLILEQRNMGNNGIEVEFPRLFIFCSHNPFVIMKSVRYFLFNLLQFNNQASHENSIMIEKFEDNLRELEAFLSYTTKEADERLRALVKHIQYVMYEVVDVAYTMPLQADKGKSLSYLFRRVINVVKEVEYVTVKVQRLCLRLGDRWNEEEYGSSYNKDLPPLIDWKTEDEAYNFRLLQLITQHMNKLDHDWQRKNPEMVKYLEPVRDKSMVHVILQDFAVLADVDGISVDNELNQDKISTVHTGFTCDNCETEPIIGVRYSCKDCMVGLGFDLCEECYTSGLVSDHTGMHNDQNHTSDHEFEIWTSMIKPDEARQI